jgi:hypothetical protein
MRKKLCSLLSTYWIATERKEKKKNTIALGFFTSVVWLFDFVTNLGFLFNDVYIYRQEL